MFNFQLCFCYAFALQASRQPIKIRAPLEPSIVPGHGSPAAEKSSFLNQGVDALVLAPAAGSRAIPSPLRDVNQLVT